MVKVKLSTIAFIDIWRLLYNRSAIQTAKVKEWIKRPLDRHCKTENQKKLPKTLYKI